MNVVGPSIVAGDDEQPRQWQFWRLKSIKQLCLDGKGGFGGPGVNLPWMGTPHKVQNPSLVCGEGFFTV